MNKKIQTGHIAIACFILLAMIALTACPAAFGYFPNEEDRSPANLIGNNVGTVEEPLFYVRTRGSNDNWRVITGATAHFVNDQEIIARSRTSQTTTFYETASSLADLAFPDTESRVLNENTPFILAGVSVIMSYRVIATAPLLYPSRFRTLTVTVNRNGVATPTFNLEPSTPSSYYTSAQELTIESTPGATLYYRAVENTEELEARGSDSHECSTRAPDLDLNNLEDSSMLYSDPIRILAAEGTCYNIKVIAVRGNIRSEPITEASFFRRVDPPSLSITQNPWNLHGVDYYQDEITLQRPLRSDDAGSGDGSSYEIKVNDREAPLLRNTAILGSFTTASFFLHDVPRPPAIEENRLNKRLEVRRVLNGVKSPPLVFDGINTHEHAGLPLFQLTSNSGALSGVDEDGDVINRGTVRDSVASVGQNNSILLDMQNMTSDRIDFPSSTSALIAPSAGTTVHIYGRQNGGTIFTIPDDGTNLIAASGGGEIGLHYITLTANEDVALASNMEGIFIKATNKNLVVLNNVRVQNVTLASSPTSTPDISGLINIENVDNVEITNSIFEDITINDGGGDINGAVIHAEDSDLTITNSTFSNIRLMGGTSTSGSALYYSNTTGNFNDLTVTNSLFSGNMAQNISGNAVGGAIAIDGVNTVTRNTMATIVGSQFINNSVSTTSTSNFARGGAIWLEDGTTTIGGAGTARNIFTRNSAVVNTNPTGAEGGAIAIVLSATGTSIGIINNSFVNNSIIRSGSPNTADDSIVNIHSSIGTSARTIRDNVGWSAPTTP